MEERQAWQGRGRLEQLVEELDRQKASRVDFVADTRHMRVDWRDGGLGLQPNSDEAMQWMSSEGYRIKDTALVQMGSKVDPDIPSKFLKELAAKRPMRAAMLLNGLMTDAPGKRLVRCLDGQVRAFLSDRYLVIENYDIAFAALDVARESGGEVVEASLSDTHMRIAFTTKQVWDVVSEERAQHHFIGNEELAKKLGRAGGFNDLPGGSGTVYPLVTISNSETGHGGFVVSIGILKGICTNLARIEDAVSKIHIGERLEQGIFAQETVHQEGKLIYMKARDAVRAAFNQEGFKRMVEIAQNAQADKLSNPATALSNLAKDHGLSEDSRNAILAHFTRDYDATRYGLAQAVSRYAQDVDDSETANDLVVLAGSVMREKIRG